jgi:hypothetical protein
MFVLVDLDDDAAADPDVSGAKAAQLARARRLGLPVLPGVVVPVAASRPAVGAAVSDLPRGSGAARLAAMRAGVASDLLTELGARAARLGEPLVVRSSSPLEDAPTWSGAFSSFLDIATGDLDTALRGCWASAFAVDPLERAEEAGVAADELTMAVLVQPQVSPDAGGLARTAGDGVVTITAVRGSPAPLLTGWARGVQIRVGADDAITGAHGAAPGEATGDEDAAEPLLADAMILAVAALARRVRSALDSDVIEWAVAGSDLHLLQCRGTASAAPAPAEVPAVAPAGLEHPLALRLARLALRHRGARAERLVLSWACAGGWGPPDDPAGTVRTGTHEALLQAAAQGASRLASIAWDLPPEQALAIAARTFAEVRGPQPQAALRRLADLRPVPARDAAEVLALVAAATDRRGDAATARDGWEPFVYGAVRAHGERLDGVAAADGIGAGVVVAVSNPHSVQITEQRPVLAAPWPLPGLAPLMWGAAGLVTGAGSPAAHLLEVAHSLRVPAVVGCPLDEWLDEHGGQRVIAAVDGTAGAVFLTSG